MANTTNSTLTTNFNVTPYYDDYDEAKDFYRILFRPGYAVQARELTQMQTIQQKQVDRFAKHIFKEGSLVLGGQFDIERDIHYVKVKDYDSSNTEITVSSFENDTIRSANSNIVAYIVDTEDGDEANTNSKTLFVRYLNANANAGLVTFSANDTLIANNGTTLYVMSANSTNVIGYGSRFTISEGVFFAKEHFIKFPTQSVILERYSTIPTCQVGFNITEEIVRYNDDLSLLDPALEASNYAAPGADRLKLIPELTRLDYDELAGPPDYVQLLRINEGVVELQLDKSQYSVINDYFAERTFDESGDYYVRGMGVRIREHNNNGVNGGLWSSNGNTSLLAIGVEPGRAYVKGYQVGNLTTRWVSTRKGIDYRNVNSQVVTTRLGSYTFVDEVVGNPPHNEAVSVLLYDTARDSISAELWSGSPTGNVIGTARAKSLEYYSGTLGTNTAQMYLYLFDIKMNGSNAFANTKSFYNNDGTSAFHADAVLVSNAAVLREVSQPLLYSVGSQFIRTIRGSDDLPDTTFTYKVTSDVTITSGGTFTVTPTESLPYSTGSLTAAEKREILLTVNASFNVSLGGIVDGTAACTVLTGTGTTFTNLNVGDKIEFSNGVISGTYTIASITSADTMALTEALADTVVSNGYVKVYKTGDFIDLTTQGATGVERDVSVSGGSLLFDLKETYSSSKSGTVTYRTTTSSAEELSKTLKPNRFVVINCDSAGTTGPYSLGFSDVYRVLSVRQNTGGSFSSNTQGTDVSTYFTFDSGQRDSFYDHASITPKGISLTSSDYLLVELDYFETNYSTGYGYFSIDSYPIDDANVANTTITTSQIPIYKSPTTGTSFDLRNYLDFRPVKAITATDTTVVASASENPSNSAAYITSAMKLPAPTSQVVFDYSYYLPRKDVVAIDKNNNVVIVQGNPAGVPITPLAPDNTMALATLYIAPYPSLSPEYGQILKRKDLSCLATRTAAIRFTMRDIGVLKSRIENLEYYASLNALEKAALDYRILDEAGLDRFKNGIFVDSFRDHNLGATYNPDYQIVVDPREKSIRPLFDMESIYYKLYSNTNVVMHANNTIATLPYTEVAIITNNTATTIRGTETATYKFNGEIFLDPDIDVWVDTQFAPDNYVDVESNNYTGGPMSTEWNSWQTNVVGYNLYDATTGQLLATFNDEYSAYNNAELLSSTDTVDRNTIGYSGPAVSTKVETVTEQSRTGSEYYLATSEDTQNLGDRVVDVSVIPYIRPQFIKFHARGLKPTTKFYLFFDGERMTSYVKQTNSSYQGGTFGYTMVSSSTGDLYGIIQIPTTGKKFRVGTKEVVVTDSPTNDIAALSTATGYFVAQGLVQQKQETILTTRVVVQKENSLYDERSTTNETVIQKIPDPPPPPPDPDPIPEPVPEPSPEPEPPPEEPPPPSNRWPTGRPKPTSCMAYSFTPTTSNSGEEGVFLTSVDIYLSSVHATLGVWFEIREMNSAGGITKNAVPFSEVWYERSDVAGYTSDDASVPFRVRFPAPVFLFSGTQYAFVIHPVATNPDYYLWVSRLGGTDVTTGNQVNSRLFNGTLYHTNNNTNWDMVPDVDLKCTFYRAEFDTSVTGSLILGNKPYGIIELTSVSATPSTYGEDIIATTLELTGNTANVEVGDYLVGENTTSNIAVSSVTESNTKFHMRNKGLGTERCEIRFANGTSKGLTTIISNIISAKAKLLRYHKTDVVLPDKVKTEEIRLVESNSAEDGDIQYFTANVVAVGETSDIVATVNVSSNLLYSVVDFEPSYLSFNKTTVTFDMKTVTEPYFPITPGENYYFDTEQTIYSRKYEVDNYSGVPSNLTKFTMKSKSKYVSPFVDIPRTHSIFVHNIINANTTGETAASGGGLINRYISRTITLAEGQDAEDIAVLLTSYRPPNTDVKVYIKIHHAEDFETFASKPWYEMEYLDDSVYSSLGNRNDFIEYNFRFPVAMLTGTNGEVQYTNGAGTTFTGYKRFAIKIGLTSTNSAIIPRVADLRVIALQL